MVEVLGIRVSVQRNTLLACAEHERGSARGAFSSYLLADLRSQVTKLGTVRILIGLKERLVTDAHGANIKLLHSDVPAY